tara:strand:- start:1745 stop:8377 length:6633 start_codon:yes stop_codon:yes gene_type:complete
MNNLAMCECTFEYPIQYKIITNEIKRRNIPLMDEFYTTKNMSRGAYLKIAHDKCSEDIQIVEMRILKHDTNISDIREILSAGVIDTKQVKLARYDVARDLGIEQMESIEDYIPKLEKYSKYLAGLLCTMKTKKENIARLLGADLFLLNSELLQIVDNHYIHKKTYNENEKDVILWRSIQNFTKSVKKKVDSEGNQMNTGEVKIISLKPHDIKFEYKLIVSRKINSLTSLFRHMDASDEVPVIISKDGENEQIWYYNNDNSAAVYELTRKIIQTLQKEQLILCITNNGGYFYVEKYPKHGVGVFSVISDTMIDISFISRLFGVHSNGCLIHAHGASLDGFSYEMDFVVNLHTEGDIGRIEIFCGNESVGYQMEREVTTPDKAMIRENMTDKVKDVKEKADWLKPGTILYGKYVDDTWTKVYYGDKEGYLKTKYLGYPGGVRSKYKDQFRVNVNVVLRASIGDKAREEWVSRGAIVSGIIQDATWAKVFVPDTKKDGFIKVKYLEKVENKRRFKAKVESITAIQREDIKIKIPTSEVDVYLPLVVYDLQLVRNQDEASVGIILSNCHPDFDELRKAIHLSDDMLFYINENETISDLMIVANTQYSGKNVQMYSGTPTITFSMQRNSNIITVNFTMDMFHYVNIITTCFVSFLLSIEKTTNFEDIQVVPDVKESEDVEVEEEEEEEEEEADEDEEESAMGDLPGYWKFIDMARYRKKDSQNQKKIKGVVTIPHILGLDQVNLLYGSHANMQNKWCMKYPLTMEIKRIKIDVLNQTTLVPFAVYQRLDDLYFISDIQISQKLYPAITHIGENTNKSYLDYLPKIFDYKTHVLEGKLSHRSKGRLIFSISPIEKKYLVFTYPMVRYSLFLMKQKTNCLDVMAYFIVCNYFGIIGFPIMKETEINGVFDIDDLAKENVFYKSLKRKIDSLPKHNLDGIIPEILDVDEMKQGISFLEKCMLSLPEDVSEHVTSQRKVKTIRSYDPLNASHFAQIKKTDILTNISNISTIGQTFQYHQGSVSYIPAKSKPDEQFSKDVELVNSFLKEQSIDQEITWNDVPRDGSCFFHCAIYGLNLQSSTDELRNKVASFLIEQISKENTPGNDHLFIIAINDFYEEADLDQEQKVQMFIDSIRRDDWGNEVTVLALSFMYPQNKFIYIIPHLQYVFCIRSGVSMLTTSCIDEYDQDTVIIANVNSHFVYGTLDDKQQAGGVAKRGRPPGSKNKPRPISPAKVHSPSKAILQEPNDAEILEATQLFLKYRFNADQGSLMTSFLSQNLIISMERSEYILRWCFHKGLLKTETQHHAVYRSGVRGGRTNLLRCIERCTHTNQNAEVVTSSEYFDNKYIHDTHDLKNLLESSFNCTIFIFDYCIDDVDKNDFLDITDKFYTYHYKQIPHIQTSVRPCYFLCKHENGHLEPLFVLSGKRMEFDWRVIYRKHYRIDIFAHIRNIIFKNFHIDTKQTQPFIYVTPKQDNITYSEWTESFLSDHELIYVYSVLKNTSYDLLLRDYTNSYRFAILQSPGFQNFPEFKSYWDKNKNFICTTKDTTTCILNLFQYYPWFTAIKADLASRDLEVPALLSLIQTYFELHPENILFDNGLREIKAHINSITSLPKTLHDFTMKTSLVCKGQNLYIMTIDNSTGDAVAYHLLAQKTNVDGYVDFFKSNKVLEIKNSKMKIVKKSALIIPKFKISKLHLVSIYNNYDLDSSLFTLEYDATNPRASYLTLEIDQKYKSLQKLKFNSTFMKNLQYSELFSILCQVCATKCKTYGIHLGLDSRYLQQSRIATSDTIGILSDSCIIISENDFDQLLLSYVKTQSNAHTKGTVDPTIVESHFSRNGMLLLTQTIHDTITIRLLKSTYLADNANFFGKSTSDIFWNNLLISEAKYRINFYNHYIPHRFLQNNSLFEKPQKIFNYFPYKFDNFLFKRHDFQSGALFYASVYTTSTIHRLADVKVNEWNLMDNKLQRVTHTQSFDHLIIFEDLGMTIHLALVDDVTKDQSHEQDIKQILEKKITFTDTNSEESSAYEAHQKYLEIRHIESEFSPVEVQDFALPTQISLRISKIQKSSLGTLLDDISKISNTTISTLRTTFLQWFTAGMNTENGLDPFVHMIRFVTQDGHLPYGISFAKGKDTFSIDASELLTKWENIENPLTRLDMILISQAFQGVLIGIYLPSKSDPDVFNKHTTHDYGFADVPPVVKLTETHTFLYLKTNSGLQKVESQ